MIVDGRRFVREDGTLDREGLFRHVRDHLLAQGRRSRRTSSGAGFSGCAYRGYDGVACAVGCLIPDERYDPSLEGESASFPAVVEAAFGRRLDDEEIRHGFTDMGLVCRLQILHDMNEPDRWRDQLIGLARELGFSP